jgi:hypothetical protein
MGYDANEDTYATSCDEFSDSETELSSIEQLFRGYEPNLLVLDGSDHALFSQVDMLIDCLKAAKLIQQVRVSTAFLQGLETDEANSMFEAIAGLAPICEIFICHLHRHLPRPELQAEGGGLLQCVQSLSHLTLNNFLLQDHLIAALGANPELTELRAYFDSKEEAAGLDPLFRVLAKSSKLTVMDVYAREDERPEKPRRLTGDGLSALCQSTSLKEIKLWHLDTELTIAMAKALETNKTLDRLTLTTCFSNNEGYSAVAKMLKVNSSLRKIYISDILSAQSCIEIAAALEDNKTLEELELTYESESDKVGRAMVRMLEKNTTIKVLKLYMSYSFENDMSFSAEKGTEYEEEQAQDDWEAKMDHYLQQNRRGERTPVS